MFYKKDDLKNFAKATGNVSAGVFVLKKLQAPGWNFIEKEIPGIRFSANFVKFLRRPIL